jgi:hypothetical protein
MFEKNGKFYADWRDRTGKRLRLSFNSKRAALQHEAEQKELARPKQRATGKLLLISSSHQVKRVSVDATGKQRAKRSSLQPVVSIQKNFSHRKSQKQSKC